MGDPGQATCMAAAPAPVDAVPVTEPEADVCLPCENTPGDMMRQLRCSVTDALGEELSRQESRWMTDEVLSIYMAARSSHQERVNLLVEVLKWRVQNRPILGQLVCATCAADPLSHDARLFGADLDGDVVFSNCFVLPRDTTAAGITEHMICLFERALQLYPSSDPQRHRRWSWVLDLNGFGSSLRHLDPRTSVALLHLLQTAYRGRLKRIVMVDAPTSFWGLWQLVKPFIRSQTAELIEFIEWPKAGPRYLELFGDQIANTLLREGLENRDDKFRATKHWTTFDGRPG